MKAVLTKTPVLAYPDMCLPFILDTDASNTGIGAVLSQSMNGRERPVAFFSQTLGQAQKNYCVTRKELLAVVKVHQTVPRVPLWPEIHCLYRSFSFAVALLRARLRDGWRPFKDTILLWSIGLPGHWLPTLHPLGIQSWHKKFRVNKRTVFSPRNTHIREELVTNSSPSLHNRRTWFLPSYVDGPVNRTST